jgi:hypothetical protein
MQEAMTELITNKNYSEVERLLHVKPIVNEQLERAGVRLATVLNVCLQK